MITMTALDMQNRARGDRPLVVVVTRRKLLTSDELVRSAAQAAEGLGLEAVALDVDDPQNAAFFDDMQVRVVPELWLLGRGVLLERCAARDADDTRRLLEAALGRRRQAVA